MALELVAVDRRRYGRVGPVFACADDAAAAAETHRRGAFRQQRPFHREKELDAVSFLDRLAGDEETRTDRADVVGLCSEVDAAIADARHDEWEVEIKSSRPAAFWTNS